MMSLSAYQMSIASHEPVCLGRALVLGKSLHTVFIHIFLLRVDQERSCLVSGNPEFSAFDPKYGRDTVGNVFPAVSGTWARCSVGARLWNDQ